MKKWYLFYATNPEREKLHQLAGVLKDIPSSKLAQVADASTYENLQHPVGEMTFPLAFGYVPWGHHIEIITHCDSIDEAVFYIGRTIQEGWSRSALHNSIKANLFHSLGKAQTNFDHALPTSQGKLAQIMTKDSYDFGFVSLPSEYNEQDLESALEQNITRFLLELGTGFAFVGRQVEIIVSGKTRRIDMLFYHIRLRCYVVLELKAKSFEPEYVGKLNFYVNAVDELIRTPEENPTLGLLICKNKDCTEVQWAFKGIDTPMGVATYGNVGTEELQKLLPSEEQIRQRIEAAEREYMEEGQRNNA